MNHVEVGHQDLEFLDEQREAAGVCQPADCDVLPQGQCPYVGELTIYTPEPTSNVTISETADRQPTSSDVDFLKANPRWRSNGFVKDISQAGYQLYDTMTFETPGVLKKWAELVITTKPRRSEPISAPCEGLEIPKDMPLLLDVCPVDNIVTRTAVRDNKQNWCRGVEVSTTKAHGSKPLQCHKMIQDYKLCITRHVRSSKRTPYTYRSVDLSKTPELGFMHYELIANDFPVGEDLKNTLKIHSTQPSYLGAVCAIQDAQGLLVHRVFASNNKILEVILDMHTRIQVNTFTPRTFALHLMKTPFTETDAVGVLFVGEAAGEWNLGCPHGMIAISQRDKYILAHHVTKCLLRAQLLTLNTLGFTLGCIQPARIWKHKSEFRLDFIGCLVDTIFDLQNRKTASVTPDVKLGLVAIHNTLLQLGLETEIPRVLAQHLEKPDDGEWDGTVFSDMYRLLTGVSVEGHWFILGSCPRYEPFTLETTHTITEPYGPFHIQIHNQYTKWNKVILVHPTQYVEPTMAVMVDKTTTTPPVNREKPHPTRIRRHRTGNRGTVRRGTVHSGTVRDNNTHELSQNANVSSEPTDGELNSNHSVMSVSSVFYEI